MARNNAKLKRQDKKPYVTEKETNIIQECIDSLNREMRFKKITRR